MKGKPGAAAIATLIYGKTTGAFFCPLPNPPIRSAAAAVPSSTSLRGSSRADLVGGSSKDGPERTEGGDDASSRGNLLQREHRPNVIAAAEEFSGEPSSEWDRIKAGTSSAEERIVAVEAAARSKRTGQAQMRLRKAVRREDRIQELEAQRDAAAAVATECPNLTKAEEAELNGLLAKRAWFGEFLGRVKVTYTHHICSLASLNIYRLSFITPLSLPIVPEEQYDEATFTEEHKAFKESHNDAFVALSLYCQRERQKLLENNVPAEVKLFFLDGPEGGTARALIDRGGFSADQCYVANRHRSTCQSLRISCGGILPEANVVHATAAEALSSGLVAEASDGDLEGDCSIMDEEGGRHDVGSFGNIEFAAYYFDGCGGFAPHLSNMMVAALLRDDDQQKDGALSSSARPPPIAIGFSIVGGNRDVVDKEVAVCQRLSILARRRGAKLTQVFDDPERYGIDPALRKVGGSASGTLTTWVLME